MPFLTRWKTDPEFRDNVVIAVAVALILVGAL